MLPLAERLHSAVFTLNLAHASYEVWWTYCNQETRDLAALNEFPVFFHHDEAANFRNLIVSLHVLFDTYCGTNTIKSLIHEVDSAAAKPIWRRYRAVASIAAKVAVLRHNAIAHRSASRSIRDIFAEARLRPDDLKRLIDECFALLAAIADALNLERPALAAGVADETRQILGRLKAPHGLLDPD